ncbi:MAG: hypothetical protein OXT07_03830 [bacterium]|nr:hypothetical protein [bacterium]
MPAPWGNPPTPVLPRWYFEALHTSPLPPTLQRITHPNEKLRFLGELNGIWEHRSLPLTKDEQSAVISLAYRVTRPPDELTAIPAGTDVHRLLQCPLRVRTRNSIGRALNANWLDTDKPVTVGQLFKLKNFGVASLLDLMCVIEAAITSGYFRLPPPPHALALSPSDKAASSTSPVPEPINPIDTAWDSAVPAIKRLLAASREINGTQTLAEWLDSNLGALASELGMGSRLNDIAVVDLCGDRPLAEEVISSLTGLWESLAQLEKSILQQRILAPEALTLEELGQGADLTRERIRQIEKIVESRLHHPSASGAAVMCWVAVLGLMLRKQFGPIIGTDELEDRISTTFPSAEQDSDDERAVAEMARYLLRMDSGYSLADGLCVSQMASETAAELRRAAQDLADGVGVIAESDLMARLPDDTWQRHWDQLIDMCGLHRLSGHLSLRDTSKAKAKAAVMSIGRPATKEEIGELCGLAPHRVGAQLSAISGVIRADKKRWGLAEWIEDEYEGIPAEIIQRIEEDGGATRLERLLEELPRMFDVAEGSVEAYAKSARFRISDGYVSVADPSAITLRALEDVIHGRTAEGLPFWSFKVEGRFFGGYSLAGLPPEIAKALGCEPDCSLRVPVLAPEGCGTVSVRWPLTSLTGATLGYLTEPLRLLGAQQGERIHLVLESSASVSLRRPSPPRPTATQQDDSDDSSERARELLERMKERRRGF